MSASLINDVGSIIVIGDEPGRTFPSASGDINTTQGQDWKLKSSNWKLQIPSAYRVRRQAAICTLQLPFFNLHS